MGKLNDELNKARRLNAIFNKIQSYTLWDVVFSKDEFFEDLDEKVK